VIHSSPGLLQPVKAAILTAHNRTKARQSAKKIGQESRVRRS
jgi:hypothetical protein